MLLLDFQGFSGDEHWEVRVFHAVGFDELIEEGLDLFPDGVSPWPQNVAARDIVIVDESRLHNHLLIPARKIRVLLSLNAQQVDLLVLLLLLPFFLLSLFFNFLGLLEEVQLLEGNLGMGQKLEEILPGELNSGRVVHRMEGPPFKVKQLLLNNEFFDLMCLIIDETEGIECSFLGLEYFYQNFLLGHSYVVMSGSYFLPEG